MDLEKEKAIFRAKARKALDEFLADSSARERESAEADDALLRSRLCEDASEVFAYVALPFEVDTRKIIEGVLARGKRAAIPRCVDGDMEFYYLEKSAPLESQVEEGAFGILEPRESLEKVRAENFPRSALVVAPGLAFSADGWRLGRGRGFYDRYIARLKAGGAVDLRVAGLCFSCQMFDEIPRGANDARMDEVFCPAKK